MTKYFLLVICAMRSKLLATPRNNVISRRLSLSPLFEHLRPSPRPEFTLVLVDLQEKSHVLSERSVCSVQGKAYTQSAEMFDSPPSDRRAVSRCLCFPSRSMCTRAKTLLSLYPQLSLLQRPVFRRLLRSVPEIGACDTLAYRYTDLGWAETIPMLIMACCMHQRTGNRVVSHKLQGLARCRRGVFSHLLGYSDGRERSDVVETKANVVPIFPASRLQPRLSGSDAVHRGFRSAIVFHSEPQWKETMYYTKLSCPYSNNCSLLVLASGEK